MNHAESEADPLVLLAEEFADRYRRGERPSLTEYADKYPELAEHIRHLFPAMVVMEEFGSVGEPAAGPDGRSVRVRPPMPKQLGEYRILREVGRGGMGNVYEAVQESLGRHVALKVVLGHGLVSPTHLERFRREARAAARLHHSNIVPVFGVGEHEGIHYYAMQFIHGHSLDQVLRELQRLRQPKMLSMPPAASAQEVVRDRRQGSSALNISLAHGLISGQLPESENSQGARPAAPEQKTGNDESAAAPSPYSGSETLSTTAATHSDLTTQFHAQYFRSVARVGVQVAEALAYAHQQGVLHRDIKPANLLLDTQSIVWITDFGLAKAEGTEELTTQGDIVGTLRYMAPERFQGRGDPRSDVYSLGLTLYEMLTLRPAFAAVDRAQLIARILREDPPRPGRLDPEIPRDLETIVLKAIAKEPRERYTTATAMAEDLRRFLADRPIQGRRASAWERTWRWCRRNRTVAALVAAVALLLLTGAVGGLVSNVLIRQEQARTNDERDRTEKAQKLAQDRAEEIERGLEGLKAANTLLDRGRWDANMHRWDDAHAAFSKAIQLRPDHVSAWVERADLYARLGLWDLAAADYAQEMERRERDTTQRWYQHALLRLHVGDADGYRQVCRRMRERFRGTLSYDSVANVLRSSVLAPGPDADLLGLVDLSQKIVDHQPWSSYSLYILGTAEYRAGRYDQAIQRLRQALAATDWGVRLLSYPILAMAQHRQGRAADARAALDEAARVLDRWTQERYESHSQDWVIDQGASVVWPVQWWDWLECRLYYREAKVLIDGSPPPDDPRLHVLHGRALAGLGWPEKAVPEYDAALKLSPQDPQIRQEAHRNRGYHFVRLGQWGEAAAEFVKACELRPDDSYLWRFRAVAWFAAGDLAAYRQACTAMLERFENTKDHETAGNVLLVCVLRDDTLPDMARLLPLTRVADRIWHWGTWAHGAALYRAGRYEESVRCFETAAKTYRPRALEWCFLAMGHYRLGHADEARRCLVEAAHWIDAANREELEDLSGTRPAWGGWYQPIVYPQLLHEAAALLGDKDKN